MDTTTPYHPSPKKRRRTITLVGIVALALVAWLVYRLFAHPDAKAAPPPPVQVTLATVDSEDFDVYDAGVGTVKANQSVTVHSRVDGELQRIGFTEGRDVRAGQVIAQLDARPLQAQLAQAIAQQGRDEASLGNAKRDLARYEDLIKDEATSQQTLDTQKSLVSQLTATVKTDAAQADYARTQLAYTTITAPISGRTGLRLVDVGNIVHAADTTGLVVIDQVDPITVVFTLPDGAFPEVSGALRAAAQNAKSLKALALTRDDARPLATGELTLIDNHIDTTSGTFQLKATFANTDHALWPGQYVNVRLYVAKRDRALVVPAAAVQRSQSGTFVYAIDEANKAQVRPVVVALTQDDRAVLTKGVTAGQKVVVDGQYKLKPGATVSEQRAGADSSSSGPASGGSPQQPGDAAKTTSNPAQQSAPENRK